MQADELKVGSHVELSCSLGSWGAGFTVVKIIGDRCTVRRERDGYILPVTFELERLRPSSATRPEPVGARAG